MKKHMKKFMKNEVWILAWGAASQRANIFSSDCKKDSKEDFKRKLKEEIFEELDTICNKKKFSDDDLLGLIKKFSQEKEGISFKVGHSQKLINMLLKYYWCMGWLKMRPPHCPVDRIILEKTGVKRYGKTPAWTKIDNIGDYISYVEDIRKFANSQNIADWELKVYSRR